MRYNGLTAMDEAEMLGIVGGVDKGAQEALYMLGYVVGVIARVFTSLFSLLKIR